MSASLALVTVGCKPDPEPPPPPTPECTVDTDCTGTLTVCERHVCAAGACTVAQLPVNTRLAEQVAGDCQVAVCGQNGVPTTAVDDTDVPNDGNECSTDVCTAGTPSHGTVAAETACGAGGGLKCDGAGKCVTCTTAADCSAGTSCQAPACVDGACSLTNLARGTKLATQTAGDCKALQCDGQGATETVDDNADVPVDMTSCTTDVCTNGTPSNPPATVRTACSEGNGLMCDGAGACVQCVMASDCPGFDTECNVRTCTAGVCGRSFTADNTPVAAQTANDCKKVVCDGQGRVVTRSDATDLPNDNNACTVDTCNGSTPVITNATSGTSCGTALVCNGTGGCVGCNTASDCPGADTECSTRTCVNTVCGRSYTANNTPVASQTANDCQKRVCDGSGNIVSINDNTDIPLDDNNQCTSQSCNAGAPVFPTVALNTACSQNGGSVCSAGGQCVQCNAATQCAGTDSECSTRTCVSNTCGRTYQSNGTPTTAGQTAGDCKQVQCAGDGGLQSAVLDTDLPASNGNQCQTPACTAGVPSYAPTALNSTCSQNGGAFCNGDGGCVQCNAVGQCSGTSTECATRLCTTAGACGWSYVAVNTPTPTQVTGDCRQAQCAGDGGFLSVALNTDLPADDGYQCTSQTCSSGTPTFPAVTAGTACTQDGGTVCSGTACVECITAADCPGSDTQCTFKTCTANRCGVSNRPSGYTTGVTQTSGDCKQAQCDGLGVVTQVALTTDVPADDGNQCTSESCNGALPEHPNRAVNFACTANGGSYCDGAGACVQCTAAAQCAGTDSECSTRTCVSNTCGRDYHSGMAIATQQSGDCRVTVCNGTGGTRSDADNTDTPPTDNNQCTFETCVAGSVSTGNSPGGTACNENGGTVCNGTGVCGSCVLDTDCPAGNECQVRKCTAGVCGFTGVTSGTPLASQTPNDCKTAVCDGSSTGGTTFVAATSDLPLDDAFECTTAACNGTTPEQQPKAANVACTEGGGSFCNGSGACVQCNLASQCGSNTECLTRTCTAGVCGADYTANGTALTSQTANDCKTVVCNGSGGTTFVANGTDFPVDDGLECTTETCNGSTPAHPVVPVDTACGTNLTSYCASSGQCVQCNVATQCAGSDTFCQARTCSGAGACGVSYTADGTALPSGSQTVGDCQSLVCNGAGAPVSRAANTDVPNDSNQCTADDCVAGVPTYSNQSAGFACTQSSGHVCDGSGTCVGCLLASDCPATGTECVINTCSANTCGTQNRTNGYVLAAQTLGDCKDAICDGNGGITSQTYSSDLPNDNNQCTADSCTGSTPTYTNVAVGIACTQSGGEFCDGSGACVLSPAVSSVSPADAATGVSVTSTIAVTFSKAMNPTTLTAQASLGTCSGSVQLSTDDFTNCIPMGTAVMSGGNTVATFTPSLSLSFGATYKLRVTTGAKDSIGLALKTAATTATGFTTTVDAVSGAGVVISQFYTNGGAAGATYAADFVELHNRGSASVSLTSYSIQYASSTGSSWTTKVNLASPLSLAAGQYYLLQTGSATAGTLPADALSSSVAMSGSAGKLALVKSTTAMTGTCPLSDTNLVDLAGFGSQVQATGCWETLPAGATVAAQTATQSAQRTGEGCYDSGNNSADFVVAAVAPRSTASTAKICSVSVNERSVGAELDFCNLQWPLSITHSLAGGSTLPTIYAQAFEAGSTEAPGAATNLIAQVGYGPLTSNPQNQSGWVWSNATFNTNQGNNDEWMASLAAPAQGTYLYGARFSYDGVQWTYCDLNGAGSNAGLTFEVTQLPTLTVTP